MSTREGKTKSVSLTRTVGKALADVLNNNKPVTAATVSSAKATSEFGVGGTGTTKSASMRRLSLQPSSKAASATTLGRGSPSTGPSGRVSRSSSTPTIDKKLATLPEEKAMTTAQPAPTGAKGKGRLSKSPKPVIQASALPKYKPKTAAALVSTAPSKIPPSPVRLGTRKRRTSEDSGSATQSSSSANEGPAPAPPPPPPAVSLSPPTKETTPRPVSPLPKRALTAKTSSPSIRPSPSPKPPKPSPTSAKPKATAKENKEDRSPVKKVARHTPSIPRISPQVAIRPPSTNSSPAKTPSKIVKKKSTTTPAASTSASRAANNAFSPDSANDSNEVSMMLNAVVSPTAQTPALPRLRPPGTLPRTPASFSNARMSFLASPLGTRGSIISWEDMSRSFQADELGMRLADIAAPFTPRDRTVSVFSDAGSMTGMSDAWGLSPRQSGVGLTPGLSISQVMFPSPPSDAADASFNDMTAISPTRPDGDHTMEENDDDEAERLFGPASPDERQAAVMLLQMQLAAMDNIREERDALRAERDALLQAAAEREAEQAEEDAARQMQEEVAQEERMARVAAEERATEEAQRAEDAQQTIRDARALAKVEAARCAQAEWRALVEMLRTECDRLRSEREVLSVVRECAVAAAGA